MARPLTYERGISNDDRLAQAGAVTLNHLQYRVKSDESARQAERASIADTRDAERNRGMDIRERELAAREKVHQQAVKDKETAISQTEGLTTSLDDLAKTVPRGTKDFYGKAISIIGKYPAALHGDARIGKMLDHYNDQYIKAGGSEESATALWELGQADTKSEGAHDYIRTIPGKYPDAFQRPEVRKAYDDTLKEAQANQPKSFVAPAGMTVDSAIIPAPGGGTMHVKSAPAAGGKNGKPDHQSKIEDYQDIMAGSAPIYGNMENGAFKGNTAGKDPQPYVQVSIQDPSGKPKTQVLDRNLFDSMVAASQARKQAQSSTPPPVAAAPDAAAPPPPATPAQPAAPGDIHDIANAAIAAGKDPNAIKDRLIQLGGDPAKLNYGN